MSEKTKTIAIMVSILAATCYISATTIQAQLGPGDFIDLYVQQIEEFIKNGTLFQPEIDVTSLLN